VLRGPLLVDSETTTCAVPPGWTLTIDDHGAERLTHDEQEA
jgi:N-methylhydantoinase A/oxoprolinase/acetone carboxylase beta subunit